MAQGANWDNPSESVPVPVSTISSFYLSADQSTTAHLNAVGQAVNSSFKETSYDYKKGPNSNTWIHRFIDALCGPGFSSLPAGSPTVRGW